MYERVQAIIFAYEDTTIEPVVDSVPGLNHRTVARHRAVGTNEPEFRAQTAWCRWVETDHLSGVLLTL